MRKSINFLSTDKRARAIFCSIIEVFLLNHTSAVFANVEYVLREQNYFPSKTEDELRTAYARLLTAIVIACNVMKIFTTVVYDYVGAWIPRMVCHLMQIIGLTFLLIATPSSPSILIWCGYPMFYGAGAGLMYSYVMIIPIFPKRTGLLYGVLGLPIALAVLFYVAFVNMGDYYKWMFVAWLGFIPFSIAHTFLNMPKSKLDFGNVRLGWETRKDSFLGNKKVQKPESDESDKKIGSKIHGFSK